MITVTRRLEFDAGHRLLAHEGKCRNVHGHRYVAEITCRAPELDLVGRVIDFSAIKACVGGWLDEDWDHAFIAQVNDPIIAWLIKNGQRCSVLSQPPTAENLALEILRRAAMLLEPAGITVARVKLYETPNCWAEVVP